MTDELCMTPDPFFEPYTWEFYSQHRDADHRKAYEAMAVVIQDELDPTAVVDVGCGIGSLLKAMRDIDHSLRICGIEAPQRREEIGNLSLLKPEDYQWLDLRTVGPSEVRQYDLCISVEVAEHLPEESSKGYVEFLCSLSDTVLFSAAFPGQGGVAHINERSFDWWVDWFHRSGFHHDIPKSRDIQRRLKGHVGGCFWYERLNVLRRD